MSVLYNISIYLYTAAIRLLAPLNRKARAWTEGRVRIFERIREALEKDAAGKPAEIAWFHCASLGEFEQGRPLIEEYRKQYPGRRIFLTFFSPSGYDVRKNYTGADFIFYLPADTPGNAERFLDLVQPLQAFFIKYEYWFNYLQALDDRKIPFYVVSAIFRPGQHFFKSYGSWFLDKIRMAEWFFLQDSDSAKLLMEKGITNFSVTGDTRFDRVEAISRQVKAFPLIAEFCEGSTVILAGSTWPADEEILFPLIYKSDSSVKFIIAPHEVYPSRISYITGRLKIPALKYSEAAIGNIQDYRVLVIDSIGILAHLYQYAFVAYIGGGFGRGIHNILEAATFGIPVVFGPNYEKFREARELIEKGGAASISNANRFIQAINNMLTQPEEYARASETCRRYVQESRGATAKIMEKING